jgi:hypothetical protein
MGEDTLNLIDVSKILKPYENKWVALSLDHKKVLGVGNSLKSAKEKAEKKAKKYVFIKLPSFDVNFVPFFLNKWFVFWIDSNSNQNTAPIF